MAANIRFSAATLDNGPQTVGADVALLRTQRLSSSPRRSLIRPFEQHHHPRIARREAMSFRLETTRERLTSFALSLAIVPAMLIGCAMNTSDQRDAVGSRNDGLSGLPHTTNQITTARNILPQTCEDHGYECGSVVNDYGRSLDCGSCSGVDEICDAGQCVCPEGYYETPSGCAEKKANWEPCSYPEECQSALCIMGICSPY